ncbi:hypothetical protein VPHK45_0066 [Vibrio phage K45]
MQVSIKRMTESMTTQIGERMFVYLSRYTQE